ncbi:uncharacterized protein E0L32_011522 [Thyridium curvatum]|uniref:Xylanolytic transcriptional activator regulatory domain-containing protein n=1 Tax=Thyridium curvatum TaxID=1093900 RepID=A0A507BH04_9PEZI|nr:uncharacterized protein E0L32_011522 [Thyridium curvatum]TPX18773.1 hypothetical protein E0L32_011522 [Thyridium curvatum]
MDSFAAGYTHEHSHGEIGSAFRLRTDKLSQVKCEGQKPECSTCRTRGWHCEYPQDGRKTAVRSKKADIRALQQQIEELKREMNERLSADDTSNGDHTLAMRASDDPNTSMNAPHDTGMVSSYQAEPSPRLSDWQDLSPLRREERPSLARLALDNIEEQAEVERVPSPDPQADETEIQVYGGTSLLHDQSSRDFWSNTPTAMDETDEPFKSATRDRLISLAALSRQREVILCSNPSLTANIDFDGVPMNMAMHLLDLHWNRLHLIYLQSYRPAIMDSLINNGPYVSKLLLNAIYLQSSLYSDRKGLRSDAQDPRTTGMTFYKRFKELVVDCIDQPNMPTVLGLLICGTCLVPYGKQKAGWVYCGMAYRMMVDLGYHLNIPKTTEEGIKFKLSATDIEIRRRVYWGAYISDKYQSLWLGRPPALRESDSNAPREFLDSFDEMAQWTPYIDPEAPPLSLGSLAYQPRTCHALIKSATTSQSTLLQAKRELSAQLTDWNNEIPAHLRFDPNKDTEIIPPHQLNLHTTYCTLVILIEQAFLNRVHFDFTLDHASREDSRKKCIDAAFKIWRLLEAYSKAFTLRHAHYGEFYAAYSAALVILQQAPQNPDEYIESIKFFWTMLSEPQKRCLGFALGLKNPFRLLKSLIRRIRFVAQHINVDAPEGSMDGSLPDVSPTWTDSVLGIDVWAHPLQDTIPENMFFVDHTMFGLFTQ